MIIEDNAVISLNVIMAATNYKYINEEISNIESEVKEILIKKNTLIAGNSTIILGVVIGQGKIIAAGCVVTKDTRDFPMYGGSPAKFIKELK